MCRVTLIGLPCLWPKGCSATALARDLPSDSQRRTLPRKTPLEGLDPRWSRLLTAKYHKLEIVPLASERHPFLGRPQCTRVE